MGKDKQDKDQKQKDKDKKKQDKKAKEQEYIQRWEAFLQKITARIEEVLAEAEQGFKGMIAAGIDDAIPFGNAMQAIKGRVIDLRGKISDVWSDQIFDNVNSQKGMDLCQAWMEEKELSLEERWETFSTFWSAEAMRSIWTHVQASMAKPVQCSQCGSELQRNVVHRPDTVTCASCGTVNQIAPEMIVGTYYAMAPHAFAEEQALPIRLAIERFRHEVELDRRKNDWSNEPLHSLERWLQMETDYWTKYGEIKHQVEGASDENKQKFIQSRVDQFRRFSLETDQTWVKAHGRS